jgi:hypothetical protein
MSTWQLTKRVSGDTSVLVEEARYHSVVDHMASGRARIEQDTAVAGTSSYINEHH